MEGHWCKSPAAIVLQPRNVTCALPQFSYVSQRNHVKCQAWEWLGLSNAPKVVCLF